MEITDPTLVFLLITLGLVGVGIEVLTPGGFVPGLVGVVALVLGVIGAVDLGATAGGIGLLILSIAFFISAVAMRLYRPLSIAGVLALIASGIFMFDRDTDPTSIAAVVVGSIVLGGFLLFVIEKVSKVKASPVRYGPEELVGLTGDVRQAVSPEGQVFIDGALWQAEISDPSQPAPVGERIQVDGMRGLTLLVSRIPADEIPNEASSQATEGADR
ncbi:MAG: NfeD family protein [Solirubrobacterales bacterium]